MNDTNIYTNKYTDKFILITNKMPTDNRYENFTRRF